MAFPNINNLNLPQCCHDRIVRINQKIKIGNFLQSALCTGTLVNIFGPSPKGINTIESIRQTDFAAFSQAVKMIPAITRKVACDECFQEWVSHIGSEKIANFWKGLMDAFS